MHRVADATETPWAGGDLAPQGRGLRRHRGEGTGPPPAMSHDVSIKRPVERSRFEPQQLRRIGLGHLHDLRLGDAVRHQAFVEREQSVGVERIGGLTEVG
jgi:hypothetical protein